MKNVILSNSKNIDTLFNIYIYIHIIRVYYFLLIIYHIRK